MRPHSDPRVVRLEAELGRVRDAFNATLASIPKDRLHATPVGGGWSPAQIVWHIAKVERGIARLLERLDSELPPMVTVPPGPRVDRVLALLEHIPFLDRSQRLKAPEGLRPPETVDLVAEQAKLVDGRAQLLDAIYVSGPRLSLLRYDHVFFGPFDGWQWAVSVARHEERHMLQLQEIAAVSR